MTHPESTTSSPAPVALITGPKHNPVLDGVRGMAILLVMIHHFAVFTPSNSTERWLHWSMGLGTTGVTLFFVLSGFLITGILLDSRGSPNFFRNFYARRTVRIFPLYYAIVFLALVAIPLIIPHILQRVASPGLASTLNEKLQRFGMVQGYEWYFWLYLCNLPMAELGKFMHGILGVCWSLAIEEQFYMIWPLVVFFCSQKALTRVCWVLIAGALVFRLAMHLVFLNSGGNIFTPTPYANPLGIYVLTPSRVDGLAIGALLAIGARTGVDLAALAPKARIAALLALPALIGARLIDIATGRSFDELGGLGIVEQSVGYSLDILFFSAVLLLAVHSSPSGLWRKFWTSRFMLVLGKYSYAIYLFHVPLRAIVRDLLYGPALVNGLPSGARFKFHTIAGSELPGQLIFFVLCTALSIGAAWISWHVFEKHCLKLKKYFPSGADRPRA